jgi:hypothetical protein
LRDAALHFAQSGGVCSSALRFQKNREGFWFQTLGRQDHFMEPLLLAVERFFRIADLDKVAQLAPRQDVRVLSDLFAA